MWPIQNTKMSLRFLWFKIQIIRTQYFRLLKMFAFLFNETVRVVKSEKKLAKQTFGLKKVLSFRRHLKEACVVEPTSVIDASNLRSENVFGL